MKEVVAIGISGGVDSSVAAYLLKEAGYDVIGITMKLIDDDATNKAILDGKVICSEIGIKHYVVDYMNEFRQIVINNFIEAYRAGKTPNPCVVCNKYFKFGLFYEKALELGASKIATGHYAKIENGKLKMANTKEKDQSYFLYGINREILDNILFPLSDYEDKEHVREIATKLNLSTKEKKDSQEICFIPNDDYISYLKNNINEDILSGDICLKDGTVLGKHNGLIHYTIGQRKGLGISYSEPLYVTEIDTLNNRVIVSVNDDLFKDELIAKNINLLVDELPDEVYAKIRSRAVPALADVIINGNEMIVKFKEKQRAITEGQSVVLYDKDGYLLGGGIIDKVM